MELANALMPTIAEIQRAVCDRKGLSLAEMKSPCRARRISWPRQVAMALCREMTNASYPLVGRQFGGMDHTTAMWADRKIRRLAGQNSDLDIELQRYRERIAELVANRPAGSVGAPASRPHLLVPRQAIGTNTDVRAWERVGGELEPA